MTFYTVLYNITITSRPFLTVYIVEGVDEIKEQWNSSLYIYHTTSHLPSIITDYGKVVHLLQRDK